MTDNKKEYTVIYEGIWTHTEIVKASSKSEAIEIAESIDFNEYDVGVNVDPCRLYAYLTNEGDEE